MWDGITLYVVKLKLFTPISSANLPWEETRFLYNSSKFFFPMSFISLKILSNYNFQILNILLITSQKTSKNIVLFDNLIFLGYNPPFALIKKRE